LLEQGAKILATDPEAIENSKKELWEFANIKFFRDHYEAIKDADLIVIVTEWKIYGELDLEKISGLTKARKILDLRNMLDAKKVRDAGFDYGFIGGN
jgi:UDPglucose 6-dehydrogenase